MTKVDTMMRCTFAIWGIAMLCLAPTASMAAADPLQAFRDQLPGKLINDPATLPSDVFGAGATAVPVKGQDMPGGAALQVSIPAKGANTYDVGLNIPLAKGFVRGVAYVVSFYARTVSADTPDGTGTIALRFQQNAAPYPGFGDAVRSIGKTWQLYEVTAIADRDVPAETAVIGLQLAGAKQVLQIGQTVVQENATALHKPIVAKAVSCKSATPVMPANMTGKGEMLNDIDALNWDMAGAGEVHERITACGVPGDSAYRFTIQAPGTHPYDITANVTINAPIHRGDTLMIGLVGRTGMAQTSDGQGVVTLRVQQNTAPYPGFGDQALSFGPAWQLKRFIAQADRDIPAGQATLNLQLAGAKQTIDLGRAYVIKTIPTQP